MTHEEKTKFFEDNIDIFNNEIEKRRRKWTLKANLSLDFDDAKQICLRHLFVKLDLYDKNKSPLSHWTNAVVSSQLSNIMRNNYYNMVAPCQRCSCSQPDNGCELYGSPSSICPLYKRWEQTKKSAYDIRLALPSENHIVEIYNIPGEEMNYETAEKRLHEEMKKILKPHEYRVYHLMIILHLTDKEIAKELHFKTSEKHRPAGYNTLHKMRKIFIEKARIIQEKVDLF